MLRDWAISTLSCLSLTYSCRHTCHSSVMYLSSCYCYYYYRSHSLQYAPFSLTFVYCRQQLLNRLLQFHILLHFYLILSLITKVFFTYLFVFSFMSLDTSFFVIFTMFVSMMRVNLSTHFFVDRNFLLHKSHTVFIIYHILSCFVPCFPFFLATSSPLRRPPLAPRPRACRRPRGPLTHL